MSDTFSDDRKDMKSYAGGESLKCYLIEDYFVTPQLATLWKELFQHSEYGNGIRVIEGGNGVGKTMMAYAMVGKFNEREAVSHLELHHPIKLTRLLDGLSMEFGLPLKDDTPAGQQMVNLRNYHHQLIQNGRRAFIIIDNAQYLDSMALSALLSIKQQRSDEGYGLNFFLFTSPNFVKKLDELGFPDVAVYDFSVPLFTESEMQHFLHDYAKRHKIDVPELRSDLAEGGSLFKRIHLGSLGSPGLALRLFETLVDEISPKHNTLEDLHPDGSVNFRPDRDALVNSSLQAESIADELTSSSLPPIDENRNQTDHAGISITADDALDNVETPDIGALTSISEIDRSEQWTAEEVQTMQTADRPGLLKHLPIMHIAIILALLALLGWWLLADRPDEPAAAYAVDIPDNDSVITELSDKPDTTKADPNPPNPSERNGITAPSGQDPVKSSVDDEKHGSAIIPPNRPLESSPSDALIEMKTSSVVRANSAFLQLIASFDRTYIYEWYDAHYDLNAKISFDGSLWITESRRRDRRGQMVPWYAVVYGPFASASEARSRVKTLERTFSINGAFVKTRDDLKSAKLKTVQ